MTDPKPPRVHRPTYAKVTPGPLPDPAVLTREVLDRCQSLGFAAAGIAPALPTRWTKEVLAWLAAGKQGEMGYLERDLDLKFEPGRVLEGAKSFIMVADLYRDRSHQAPPPRDNQPRGRVARYAQGRNYHWVMKDRLHKLSDELRAKYPGSEFRTFVDTVPILERELAQLAGIGWQAKNTMLIHPRLGSYLLFGGVATTLPLAAPPDQPTYQDHCGTCTRCIDACPTEAITPYSVNGSRCISYLTIEHRTPIDTALRPLMGDWIYGCDICQEVCPHNSPRSELDTGQANDAYTATTPSIPLLDVLNWTEPTRRAAFTSTAMKRATLAMMKRNAIIAAGNFLKTTPNRPLLDRLRAIATDSSEPELVTKTAFDTLAALGQ